MKKLDIPFASAVKVFNEEVGWLLALANCRLPGKVENVENKKFHLFDEDDGTWQITVILDWDRVNYSWVVLTTCPESVFFYHH